MNREEGRVAMVKETSHDDANNNAASKRERLVSFNVEEGGDQLKKEVGKEAVLDDNTEGVESVDKTKQPITKPEPFEPDLRPREPEHESPEPARSELGKVNRPVQFPAEDVRETRREERLMRKEKVEKEVSMMIGESALKVEIWMDADRAGIKG